MVNIELIKAKTFELDPNKKYLIIFSQYDMSLDDAQKVMHKLEKQGITGLGIQVKNTNNLKIVETQ